MNNINLISAPTVTPAFPAVKLPVASSKQVDNPALRKAFDEFVGQTFYGQLLKEMRKSQGNVAYFGGGQAEEVFTQPARPGSDQENDRRRRRQAERPVVQPIHAGTKVGRLTRSQRRR